MAWSKCKFPVISLHPWVAVQTELPSRIFRSTAWLGSLYPCGGTCKLSYIRGDRTSQVVQPNTLFRQTSHRVCSSPLVYTQQRGSNIITRHGCMHIVREPARSMPVVLPRSFWDFGFWFQTMLDVAYLGFFVSIVSLFVMNDMMLYFGGCQD